MVFDRRDGSFSSEVSFHNDIGVVCVTAVNPFLGASSIKYRVKVCNWIPAPLARYEVVKP